MMFRRNTIGLEIYPNGIRMALVGGTRAKPLVEGLYEAGLDSETIRISLREPNILKPAAFVQTIRETYLRLLTKTVRVAVALPDSAGRVMLVDLDTRFKNTKEAEEVIRWKLKKNFPFDIKDAHFDFQQIGQKETGEITVLVSLICRQVLNQYENLLVEAGLEPNQIDFTSFCLFEFFSGKLSLDQDMVFVSYFDAVISLLVFNRGVPVFFRTKEIGGKTFSANRVFREITSSLLVYQDNNPGIPLGKVYCFIDKDDREEFRGLTAEATNQEPVILDIERVIAGSGNCRADGPIMFAMTAAFGAALRNL